MASTSRGKTKGKEPEVKRLLDAQERVFLPERQAASKAYFEQANSHPKETFVKLQDVKGKNFHVTNVVEDFIIAPDMSVKDILGLLTYYHDQMPTLKSRGEEVRKITSTLFNCITRLKGTAFSRSHANAPF